MSEMRTQLMKIISESYDRGVADALKTAVEATEKAIANAVAVEREELEKELLKLKRNVVAPRDYTQGRWDLIGEFQDIIRARGKKT